MEPCIQELKALLASTRALFDEAVPDTEQLRAWGEERNALFAKLRSRDLVLECRDATAVAALIVELLEANSQVRVYLSEQKEQVAKQMFTVREARHMLRSHAAANAPRLVHRIA